MTPLTQLADRIERAGVVLSRAADLIEQTGWTQGVFARDKFGVPVSYNDMRACCFCIRGALARVSNEWDSDRAEEVLEYILPRERKAGDAGSKITRFNDREGRTQAEVVAALRQAALSFSRADDRVLGE